MKSKSMDSAIPHPPPAPQHLQPVFKRDAKGRWFILDGRFLNVVRHRTNTMIRFQCRLSRTHGRTSLTCIEK